MVLRGLLILGQSPLAWGLLRGILPSSCLGSRPSMHVWAFYVWAKCPIGPPKRATKKGFALFLSVGSANTWPSYKWGRDPPSKRAFYVWAKPTHMQEASGPSLGLWPLYVWAKTSMLGLCPSIEGPLASCMCGQSPHIEKKHTLGMGGGQSPAYKRANASLKAFALYKDKCMFPRGQRPLGNIHLAHT